MRIIFQICFACLLFVMTLSCAMKSEYNSSLLEEPFQKKKAWKADSENLSPSQIIQPDWWTQFKDPFLNQLIREALSESFDLKIAVRRIQEAGLNIKDAKAKFMPSVNASGSANFSQYQNTQEIPDEVRNATDAKTILEKLNSQYLNTSINISWEMDLWGKKKRSYLVSEAGYEESKATYRAEYLKVISEVAQTYFDLREKDKEIDLAKKSCEDNRQRLSIYENQYSEGIIPEWKVLRQKAEMKNSEKELSELQQSRKSLENKIAVCLGKPPGEFNIPKTENQEFPQVVRVPAGLPADLLARRPDIIAAKYRVIKSHHQLKESELAWLPTVSLTGNAGLGGNTLSALLQQWSFGFAPSISFPVFDGGSNKNRVAINQLQLATTEDEYRRTVLKAFEEVENTLTALSNLNQQKEILEEKLITMRQINVQTRAKFESGLISQLEVSDIDRELYSTEKALLTIHSSLSDNTVTLFKALGGGWTETAESPKITLSNLTIIENEE